MRNADPIIRNLTLTLASGRCIKVVDVFLTDLVSMNDSAILRASAERGLAGVSTGVGFLGSPQWAIGGALAVGLIESLASSVTAKQAVQDLQRANRLSSESFSRGDWVPVSELQNLQTPDIRKWWALTSDLRRLLVHSGEQFLFVRSQNFEQLMVHLDRIETIQIEPPLDPRTPLADPQIPALQNAQVMVNEKFSLPVLSNRSKLLRALNAAAAMQKGPRNSEEKRKELLESVSLAISRNAVGEVCLIHSNGSLSFINEDALNDWIQEILIPMIVN